MGRQSPLSRKSPLQERLIREEEEESDSDELAGAYTKHLEQRGSPFGNY